MLRRQVLAQHHQHVIFSSVIIIQICFTIFFSAWWLSKKCYNEMLPEYRCYDLKSPYTNTLLHYPKSPTDQNIHFKLFTNSNPTSAQILGAQDKNSVTSSNFNANGKVFWQDRLCCFLAFPSKMTQTLLLFDRSCDQNKNQTN